MLRGIITQNVDGLHQAAGARDVVELHGALDRVVCLECGARSTREALDQHLRAANPDLDWDEVAASNPDGDAELAEDQIARFRLVGCECVLRVRHAQARRCVLRRERAAVPGAAVLWFPRRLGLSARARVLANGDVRAAVRAPGSAGADPGGDHQPGRDSWRRARRRPSKSTPRSARYCPRCRWLPNRLRAVAHRSETGRRAAVGVDRRRIASVPGLLGASGRGAVARWHCASRASSEDHVARLRC